MMKWHTPELTDFDDNYLINGHVFSEREWARIVTKEFMRVIAKQIEQGVDAWSTQVYDRDGRYQHLRAGVTFRKTY